jgi:hypothetical protein
MLIPFRPSTTPLLISKDTLRLCMTKIALANNSKLTVLVLASVMALSLSQTAFAAASSTASSYSFNLIGPNMSVAQATIPGTPILAGDTLSLTGSGIFNTSKGTASGGGSFTHTHPDGTVFARGTWVVTAFQDFASYGGPSPGHQGGVLHVTVTLFGPEATFRGLTLQVSCRVNAPSGAPDEGTTLPGLFSDPTGGNTLFHLGA